MDFKPDEVSGRDRVHATSLRLENRLVKEWRDELLNGEKFYSLKEAKIVIEQWRKHYNT